jgi:hypothetical protein
VRAQIVLVALAFVSLLLYSGHGIVRLLTFDRIRGGELVLAPAVGAAFLVTVGSWTASRGGSAGVALVSALVIATLLNVLALRLGRPRSLDVWATVGGGCLAILVIAVGVAPLWLLDKADTVIGRNGDQVSYTNFASYLARHGLPVRAPGPLEPAATQLWLVDQYGMPIGFSHVHAMVDRLTGQPAYATLSIVTVVFLALNVLAVVFLAERLFGLRRWPALAAGVLTAASPALMWIHYNNYAMQALAIGLIPAGLGIAILALEDGRMRGLALAALLLSGIFVTYPPAAGPFLLAPVAVYGLFLVASGIRPAIVATRYLTLGLIMLLMNLAAVLYMAKVLRPMIFSVLLREFGDVTTQVSPIQIFGLVHHALPPPPGWMLSGVVVVAAIATLLAAYGAVGSGGMPRRLLLSVFLTAVPFLLWLRFGLDYAYGFYKGLMFIVTPALIALLLGVQRSLGGPAAIGAGAVAVVLIVVAASGANLLRQARTASVFDVGAIRALSELARLAPRDQPVHVRDESGTALLWVTFFLRDRGLYLAHYSPYYLHRDWRFYQQPITAPLVLVNRDVPSLTPWDAGTVYENLRYRVLRKEPGVLAHLDFSHELNTLRPDDQLRVSFLPGRVVVDGRPFVPGLPTAEGRAVALGLWTTSTATVRLVNGTKDSVLRVTGDRDGLSWPASPPPSEMAIVNAGPHSLLVPGWIAVVTPDYRPAVAKVPDGPLTIARERILPGSDVFLVRGWHGLEGSTRWTGAAGLAAFRNPREPSSLAIDCASLRPPSVAPPGVTLLVNGRSLGPLTCSGTSSEMFQLTDAVLGGLSWGWLEIRVDPVFIPRSTGISTDGRALGVLVRGLRLEPRR